jgi:SNF2 family DNA or RNA helicase|tara:strand:- start:166 stop:1605 length:1440 start_codon:yes stop_codon:yes gene_type:complete
MNFLFKTKPYQHQLDALNTSCERKEFALFMEMGCGKSKVVIDNFIYLYRQEKLNGVVILAPKGVYDTWYSKEIPRHTPEETNYHVVKWSNSSTKKNKKLLSSLSEEPERLNILIMNIEALSTKKGTQFVTDFLFKRKSMFIIDESTTIKNHKAKRTINAVRLGKYAYYKRILTGSPVTKSPLDLYSQAYFLDPSLLGFSSYYSFRARYANLAARSANGRTYKQVLGYKNLTELNESLLEFSSRVLKKDCLDLPDKIYLKRSIQTTDEQRRIYKELQRQAKASLSQGTVTITHLITQIIRLHQVSCGFVKLDNGNITEIPNQRLPELLEILEETDGKVIIWANYRHDIQKIEKELAKLYGEESIGTYYGDVPQDRREEVINKFQDPDSPLRFFVGNTQTGGYGITLTAANTVIYYSNNYDLEKRLQSEDRAHRIGQTNKVTYIDIVCERTVDEKIVKALRMKQNIAQTVLGEEKWKNWLV